MALVFGFVTLPVRYQARTGFVERGPGVLLLALYVAYLTAIVQGQASMSTQT